MLEGLSAIGSGAQHVIGAIATVAGNAGTAINAGIGQVCSVGWGAVIAVLKSVSLI